MFIDGASGAAIIGLGRRSRLCLMFLASLVVLIVPRPLEAAGNRALAGKIRSLVTAAGVGDMRVGVRVIRLDEKPEVVFEHRSDELFKPASNMKIVTTAAALCLLPEDFTYRTLLVRCGDDLGVIGAGDPSFGDPRIAGRAGEPITAPFHRWAAQLELLGVTEIEGNLVFDDFIFDQQHVHASWREQHNLLDWYTAPVGGLNFNDNCIDVVIRPADKMGELAEVRLVPRTAWVELANSAKTAKSGEPLVHRRGDGPLTISVKGSVSRPNDPKNPLSIPVTDPGVFFATTFKTVLAAKGIRVHGEVVRRRLRTDGRLVPAKCEIVALHQSKLEDFLWRVNKSSQNMFAEALVKTIGAYGVNAAMPRTGSAKSGAEMIGLWLESLGLTPDAFTIDDGSGLSHDNRLTPRAVSSVLVHMDTHPKRAVYRESLAVPGEQVGTLRRRLRSLDDQVRAKTGYIRGVSALSGYVTAAGGERYAFTMLCNDIGRHKGTGAKTLQNRLCELLAQ